MTKYFVQSGGMRRAGDFGKKYLSEFLLSTKKPKPNILMVFFAKPRYEWESLYKEWTEYITSLSPGGVKPVFELAFPKSFVKQIKNSDGIFIFGGDTKLLFYWLKQFEIPQIWDDKLVSTASASSQALSKYFYSPDWDEFGEGFGILPIKFIPHYKSDYGLEDDREPVDWDKVYKKLEDFGEKGLEIVALKEGEYRVFEA